MFAEYVYPGVWSHQQQQQQQHVVQRQRRVMLSSGYDDRAAEPGRDLRSVTPGGGPTTAATLPFLDVTPHSVIERIRSRSVTPHDQDQIASFGNRTVAFFGSSSQSSASRVGTARSSFHLPRSSTSLSVLVNGGYPNGSSHGMIPTDPLGTMSDPFNLSVTWPSPTKIPRTPVSLPPPSRGGRRLLEPLVTPPNGSRSEGSGSDREGSSVPNIRMPLTPNPSTRCSSGIRPVIPPLTPRGSRADKDHMMVQMRLEEMTTEDRSSCSEDNDDDDVTVRFNGVRLPARETQKCGSSTSTRDSGVSSASCRERMRGPDTPHHSSLRSVHSKDETKYHDARSKHEPPERKKSVTFRAANVHDSRRMSSTEKLLPLEDPDDRLQRQKMRLHDAAQLPTRLQHVSLESSSEDEEYEVQSDDEEEDDEDEEDDRYLNKRWSTDGLYNHRRRRSASLGLIKFNNGRTQYETEHEAGSVHGRIRRPPQIQQESSLNRTPSYQSRPRRQYVDEYDSDLEFDQIPAENPNDITLSSTMLSKIELLQKKRDNMQKIEQRKLQASEERARKFKALQSQAEALSPPPVPVHIASPQPKSRRNSIRSRKSVSDKSPNPPVIEVASPKPPPAAAAVQQRKTPPKTPGGRRPLTRGSGVVAKKSRSLHDVSNTWGSNNSTMGVSSSLGSMRNLSSKSPSVRTSCFPDNLPPFKDPNIGWQEASKKLDSDDWEKNVDGVQEVVRLCQHHSPVVTQHLKDVNHLIMKQVKNLRSQVCRAAIQSYVEIFTSQRRHMEPYLDKVGPLLLQKTGETNRFIKEDCNIALDSMVDSVSPVKAASILVSDGLTHKNNAVRGSTSRLFARLVDRMGPSKFFAGSNRDMVEKILPAMIKLVADGNPEARHHAKRVFNSIMDLPEFDSTLKKYVPAAQLRSIEKTLEQIRNQAKHGQLNDATGHLSYSRTAPKLSRSM